MPLDLFSLEENNSEDKSVSIQRLSNKDIAIIGIGLKLPSANTVDEFWNNIMQGMDCIGPLSKERQKDLEDIILIKGIDKEKVRFFEAAYLEGIDKFDYSFFGISHKEASLMDPCQRIFLETVWHAIEDSGYSNKDIEGSKTGIFLGYPASTEYLKLVETTEPYFTSMATPGNIPSIIASRIAYLLDLKGPSMLIDTACSSSLVAIHQACQSIRKSECNMAIVGGINLILDSYYSKDLEKPEIHSSTGRTRAFDYKSDGTGIGEGCVAMILKPLDSALSDGDNIYAVLKGSAINQDGKSVGLTAPNLASQREVIKQAWKDADINPETLSYIEAHGTGTVLGDPIEIDALTQAFKLFTEKKQFCAIGSLKTNIGHLDSAAGIAGVAKVALALSHKKIPKQINFEAPNPKIEFENSPLFVSTSNSDWNTSLKTPRRCGVSAFGLSGTNCHVVLQEGIEQGSVKNINQQYNNYILTLSARNLSVLNKVIENYEIFIDKKREHVDLHDICYTSNIGRNHYNHRLAIFAHSYDELKYKLKLLKEVNYQVEKIDNVYYGVVNSKFEGQKLSKSNKGVDNDIKDESIDLEKVYEQFNNHELSKEQFIDYILNSYVRGGDIKWQLLYLNEKRKRVSLPLYPFEKNRCWINSEYIKKSDMKVFEYKEEKVMESNFQRDKEKRKIEIIKHLTQFISNAYEIPLNEIDVTSSFFEIGIDSISIIQIKQEIMIKYNVELTFNQLYSALSTIESLAEYIDNQLEEDIIVPHKEVQNQAVNSLAPQVVNTTNIANPANMQDKYNLYQKIIQSQMDILNLMMNDMQGASVVNNNVPNVVTTKDMLEQENEEYVNKTLSKQNKFFRRFIVREDIGVNEEQLEYLKWFIPKYNEFSKKSKAFTAEHRKHWANERFVQGYSQVWKEIIYPIIAKRAQGSRIWDLDDNEYIDFAMGFGVIILGYNHPAITNAIKEHLDEGIIIGPVTPLAGEVAKLISEMTGVERVSFYNSGTEAVMNSVRLARATTDKNKIVMFNGSYHGSFDGVFMQNDRNSRQHKSIPMSLGTPPKMADDVIVLEYGAKESLDIIRQNAHELAAVLVEPVQSRRPQLQPVEFLRELRKITLENDIALIFDEVITGFRIHPAGAQGYYGIQADIVAYGKVAGGSMPIGIVAGKAKYLNRTDGGNWNYMDDSYPDMKLSHHGGTFNCHPITMAVAKNVLSYLNENKNILYKNLNERVEKIKRELNDYFAEEDIPLEIVNCASMFSFKPKRDVLFLRFLFYHLAMKGIYLWEGATCFLSEAHTDEDIDTFISKVKECCKELTQISCFAGKKKLTNKTEEQKITDIKKVLLTDEQANLFVLASQDESRSLAYNEYLCIELKGKINFNAFEKAAQKIVDRHEILRVIKMDKEYQYISPKMNVEVNRVSQYKGDDLEKVKKFINQQTTKAFNFNGGGLIRFYLIDKDNDEYVFLLVVHHIIADGWSMNVLMSELIQIYAAECHGMPVNLSKATSFSEYTKWLESQRNTIYGEKAQEYWLKEFSKPIKQIAFSNGLFGRSSAKKASGVTRISLDSIKTNELKKFAKCKGLTLSMALLSVYSAFIYRLKNVTQMVIGVPFSGQLQMEADRLVGQCVKMIPIYITINEEDTLSNLMATIKEKFLQATDYQNFSYKRILEYANKQNQTVYLPEMQLVFNMDKKTDSILNIGDLEIGKSLNTDDMSEDSKYDLFLDVLEQRDTIELKFDYNASSIPRQIMEVWTSYFINLLNYIDQADEVKIKDITLENNQ